MRTRHAVLALPLAAAACAASTTPSTTSLAEQRNIAAMNASRDADRDNLVQTAQAGAAQADAAEIETVLDALHHAAATADEETYFSLYAPGAVFFGTDATERWSVAQLRAYGEAAFQRESAWVYTPTERHVFFSADGQTAWFDERLHNERYGETRGTGVLRRLGGAWKIAQYNLTIPIPNALASDVAEMIKRTNQGR